MKPLQVTVLVVGITAGVVVAGYVGARFAGKVVQDQQGASAGSSIEARLADGVKADSRTPVVDLAATHERNAELVAALERANAELARTKAELDAMRAMRAFRDVAGEELAPELAALDIAHTKVRMGTIESAVQAFRVLKRRLPESLDELLGDVGLLEGDAVPTDKWGRPFVYTPRGAKYFDLVSYGADGAAGGGDDITRDDLTRR